MKINETIFPIETIIGGYLATKPIFIMTCGIPGCGKSTWCKKQVAKFPEIVYICPDDLRRKHGTSVNDQSVNGLVWSIVTKEIIKHLDNKEKNNIVILDATSLQGKQRRSLMKAIKRHSDKCDDALMYCCVFYEELETCWNRMQKDIENKVDRANVPRDKMESMFEVFKIGFKSLLTDGFDDVYLMTKGIF